MTATETVTAEAEAVPQQFADTSQEEEPEGEVYANCSEARAAGAAPLYRGDPGYRPKLDRDDDGVACE
ncbi:excalibur calcium-binding domain-containing protein [Mobilicoccus sp.]|uniref:excalibur calcium-binding domain-containing protein n=1 Tax=Mobilicoccus sp. TaxID=2034349 RepID=UPI0028B216EF|nr:excalibur calcium-binding domain-containing protein [Mobilicoccus sp.]